MEELQRDCEKDKLDYIYMWFDPLKFTNIITIWTVWTADF